MKKFTGHTFVPSVICIVLCAFCVPVKSDQKAAKLSLVASSDSNNASMRQFIANRYLDTNCTKPKKNSRLLRKKYAKIKHEFKALDIPADELFVFQVDYNEKRRNSERSCSSSIGFTPLPGRFYKAVYDVSGQVSRCRIELYDVTEAEQKITDLIKPEIMCTRKGAKGNRNGVPTHSLVERL